METESVCGECGVAVDRGDAYCRGCGVRLGSEGVSGADRAAISWRALLDLSPEALALVDAQDRIVRVNSHFEWLSGYERTVLENGMPVGALLRPLGRGRFGDSADALSPDARPPTFVVALQRRTGEERLVEAAFHLPSSDRFVIGLREVTEERLTQRRLLTLWHLSSQVAASLDADVVLRSLVEYLAEFLEIAQFHVALVDAERGEMLPAVVYTRGQGVQHCLRERKAARRLEDSPLVMRAVQELESIEVRPAAPEDWRSLALPALASERPAWTVLVPMIVRGRALGIFVLADDRSERALSPLELSICQTLANQAASALENARLYEEEVRSRTEIARLHEYHRSILDAINFGVAVVSPRGTVQFWNRRMEAMTGLKREAILGQNLFARVEHLTAFRDAVLQIGKSRKEYRIERLSRATPAADGDTRGEFVESYLFRPLTQGSRMLGILCVVEDVTAKVRMDEQLVRSDRMAAVGELAAGVAHNFNNILAAIGGDAQLLKMMAEELQLPQPVIETAQMIYQESMRGGTIAHDLMSFARGSEPNPQVLPVEPLLDEVIRLVANHPSSKNVRVERHLDENLPQVHVDPTQLHQVFMNITLNAVQAMAGEGTLTVRAHVRASDEDADRGVLEISFTDTGVGIPPDRLRRIFDPFYSERRDGGLGTGLGLTVTLAMVQGMGGKIHVMSDVGRGTTFTVVLPIVERRTDRRNRPLPRGRILLVDDEPSVRRTVASFLAKRGYQVHTAQDGEEAVVRVEQAAAARPYDVVLMDLMLPKIDGARATSLVKASDPNVEVVLLTGVTSQEAVHQALEHGARFSFTKPLNFAELLNVVESLRKTRRP